MTITVLQNIMKKTHEQEISVLEKYEEKTGWREKAQWRRDNRCWLRYSGFIAVAVLHQLEMRNIRQKDLAEKMGCSPQYISKILKGSENLTLETISKLEDCLDLDLVKSALSYVDGYERIDPPLRYVAEPDSPEYGESCSSVPARQEGADPA